MSVTTSMTIDPGAVRSADRAELPNQVKSVRARGTDPLRMSMSDASSAAERTLANAVETGILKHDKVVPRLDLSPPRAAR